MTLGPRLAGAICARYLLLGLVYAFAEPFSFRANAVGFAVGFLVAAAVVYALFRAVGWIIAGFAGD